MKTKTVKKRKFKVAELCVFNFLCKILKEMDADFEEKSIKVKAKKLADQFRMERDSVIREFNRAMSPRDIISHGKAYKILLKDEVDLDEDDFVELLENNLVISKD